MGLCFCVSYDSQCGYCLVSLFAIDKPYWTPLLPITKDDLISPTSEALLFSNLRLSHQMFLKTFAKYCSSMMNPWDVWQSIHFILLVFSSWVIIIDYPKSSRKNPSLSAIIYAEAVLSLGCIKKKLYFRLAWQARLSGIGSTAGRSTWDSFTRTSLFAGTIWFPTRMIWWNTWFGASKWMCSS